MSEDPNFERRLRNLERNIGLLMHGMQALLLDGGHHSTAQRFNRALDEWERERHASMNGDDRERDTDPAPPDAE